MRALGLALIILCTTCVRALYVSLYSSDIPFWDQWDLLNRTLAPWWNDGHWPALFEPHNEHRIAFTRLISMALLALNGGVWSNLVESYVNTLIYAAVLALFYAYLGRELKAWPERLLLLGAVLAVGCLPFDWENTLVGFQNQFYLMAAGAMLLVGTAAHRETTCSTLSLLAVLAAAALFTMASGLLAPLAVIAVLVLRMWRSTFRLGAGAAWTAIALMAATAAAGLLLTPTIAGHATLKAQGLIEHAHAFVTFLSWPLEPFTAKHSAFVLVIWWPLLVWACRFLKTRQTTDGELFAVGMLLWVLLQAMAFAHARGHDATELTSRYSDIPALGLVANLALALLGFRQMSTALWRRIMLALITVSTILVCGVLIRRLTMDLAAMHQRHQFLLIETHYTQAYLRDRNADALKHPGLMVPFISGDALREMLDKPSIVKLLPPVLIDERDGSSMAAAGQNMRQGGWLTRWAVALQATVQRAFGHGDRLMSFQPTSTLSDQSHGQGQCYVDTINAMPAQEVVQLRNDDPLQLDGWVVDPSIAHAPIFEAVLVSQANFGIEARAFGTRHDVVKALHTRPEISREFSTLGIIQGLPAGDYALVLATKGPASRTICRPLQTIRIVP